MRNSENRISLTKTNAVQSHSANQTKAIKLCSTEECEMMAEKILNSMDKSVKPCDDFYAFACGNFLKKTQVSVEKPSDNADSFRRDIVSERLKTLASEHISKSDPTPYRFVKQFYADCMNTSKRCILRQRAHISHTTWVNVCVKLEELGLQPARNMLRELGGWPVVEGINWKEASFTWMDSVFKFRRYGLSTDYLLPISISYYENSQWEKIITLKRVKLSMNAKFLVHKGYKFLVNAYYKYMVDIAVMFGANSQKAYQELKESLEFEKSLAKLEYPSGSNSGYTMLTVSEMQQRFPSINWLEYLNKILAPNNAITQDENIMIYDSEYMKLLATKLLYTRKRVLANYIMWRAVESSIFLLNNSARKHREKFYMIRYQVKELQSRWKECNDYNLQMALGSMYVRKYFKKDTRQQVLKMVQNIRNEMYESLTTVTWMDDVTRSKAFTKLKLLRNEVGYSDELMDDGKLERYYNQLKIYPGELLKTFWEWRRWERNLEFSKLRVSYRKEWLEPFSTIAKYHGFSNSIVIPAGYIQHPTYSADRPQYLNYGMMGFVIGHELTHAFDYKGSKKDGYGNEVNWWEPSTKSRYFDKVQCLVDQYGKYTARDLNLKLDGERTMRENVADNNGFRIAYRAYYANWVEKHIIEEPRLRGLEEYDPMQMFWISAANEWCSKDAPYLRKIHIESDTHSPAEFRVIGSFSNQRNFARDFNCPKGSKMNPAKKCKVW